MAEQAVDPRRARPKAAAVIEQSEATKTEPEPAPAAEAESGGDDLLSLLGGLQPVAPAPAQAESTATEEAPAAESTEPSDVPIEVDAAANEAEATEAKEGESAAEALANEELGLKSSEDDEPKDDNENEQTAAAATTTKPTGSKPVSSLSRVAQLQARVAKDKLDGEAQLALLADAEAKGDLERTREVYEQFLAVFPDQAQQWIGYCDLELSHNLFGKVEALFGRCLISSASVQLWKFYLDYIRRINPIDPSQPDKAKTAKATINQSFEFALNHVGQDRQAGEIWIEYIRFLKEGQNRGTWEDGQRMDALRRAYQRAVQIPLNAVEAIWQEYTAFESQLNKMTAKKFVTELSPSYMTARGVLRELRGQFDELISPSLPRRPDLSSTRSRDYVALDLWRRYLAYEQTNPLELEDPSVLNARVMFAFKQALGQMRFYPEIWYLAAAYSMKQGRNEEAQGVLKTGLAANPSSALLAYTLAELKEAAGDIAATYAIYDDVIARLQTELSEWEAETEKEVQTALQAIDASEEASSDDVEVRQRVVGDKEDSEKKIRDGRKAKVVLLKEAAANVWIAEIRFARRAEGVKPARTLFSKARKTTAWIWQLAVATANLELLWNKETKVATNIFELGFKVFASEPLYVLEYLDFLIQINDHNNARALFERTVALLDPTTAKPVWDRMATFEFQYGDFLAVQKMAKRYEEAFPDTSAVDRFAQRFGYLGTETAIAGELGWRPTSLVGLVPTVAIADADAGARRSRSPSPRRRPGKRELSVEPSSGQPMSAANSRDELSDKRMRVEGSPAPPSHDGPDGGRAGGWGRVPPPNRGEENNFEGGRDSAPPGGEFRRGGGGGPRGPPPPPPGLNRPTPFILDGTGDNVGVLPDAVVFFLSILPPSKSFNGPMLNPATMVDVIGSTMLPGTAPGPGLPGERLGVPPRPKPAAGGGGGGGGGRFGGRY